MNSTTRTDNPKMGKFRDLSVSIRAAVRVGLLAGVLLFQTAPSEALAQGGAAFLKLGVGARALGMGGAFTAVADDATALFWNPAGLTKLEKGEVTGMHAQLSLDRRYDFLGYGGPLKNGKGAWGISYTRFSVDGIPETRVRPGTALPQLTDDTFDAADNFLAAGPGLGQVKIFTVFDDVEQAVTGSYARRLGDRWRAGATLRYLNQDLFNVEASGLGLDLGLLYDASKDWTFGLAAKDLLEELDFDGGLQDAEVDVTTSAGVAYRGIEDTLISVEATRTGNQGVKLRAGAERWFADSYAIRLGSNRGDFSAGASARIKEWQFDYAYQAQELGDIQRISFVHRF